MTIENPERFERTEAYLKQRISDYKEVMPVQGWGGVTLLEIYWEWMGYLVKENLKWRSNLLIKWKDFLLQYNTDAIADLLIGFFDAKRRYGRDKERGEDKRNWFALCKNYCKINGWDEDETLVHSFFSSYSAAERRIYKKVETGKVLAGTSKSLLQIITLTKEEMIKKDEEKKKKAEEKIRKKEEKRQKKQERANKVAKKKGEAGEKKGIREEGKAKKAAEKNLNGDRRSKEGEAMYSNVQEKLEEGDGEMIQEEKKKKILDEWAVNHYGGNDRDIVDENGDIIPNPSQMHILQESIIEPKEMEKKKENMINEEKKDLSKGPKLDKDGKQYLIDFPDFED